MQYIEFCFSLSELEMTRDDLLIQLYQSSEAFVDKNTVEFSNYLFWYLFNQSHFIMSVVFASLL